MKHSFILAAVIVAASASANAQTATSLFLKSDRIQTNEIFSEDGNLYQKVGHHGPAVENGLMALRIYFNDSGAIDVYSKSGAQMELLKYLWYPTAEQQSSEGAGCDEYRVGKTVGLGGVALWSEAEGKEVNLAATKGRRARAGKTDNGSYAEIISYGVPYCDELVDISVRVDVIDGCRFAKVTATELNGRKVSFLTGVNYHPTCDSGSATLAGSDAKSAAAADISSFGRFGQYKSVLWAWGIHPADVSANPIPIGGGMVFSAKQFPTYERTDDMLRIISVPTSQVSTFIVSASTKEPELNSAEAFCKYLGTKY